MANSQFTAGISVMPCPSPGCTCGGVVVQIHDDAGQSGAGIVLPRPMAEAFIAQFGAVLERASGREPSPLHTIRCEGTA